MVTKAGRSGKSQCAECTRGTLGVRGLEAYFNRPTSTGKQQDISRLARSGCFSFRFRVEFVILEKKTKLC